MSPQTVFQIQLILGYLASMLCLGAYALPRLNAMDRVAAHRVIATVHSFRFFGLVFIVPGVVGPHLQAGFAGFAAYGDLATAVLAILALLTVRVRPLFWTFVVAFNVVGAADLIIDYYHAVHLDVPAMAGQFGAAYVVPIIYVPALMITHAAAFYFLLRRHPQRAWTFGETARASHA
jgi:hypothetical protein